MTGWLGAGALFLGLSLLAAFGAHMGTQLYGTGGFSTRFGRRMRNTFLALGAVLFLLCALAGLVEAAT